MNGGRSSSRAPISESGSVSNPQGFFYPTNRFLLLPLHPPTQGRETERETERAAPDQDLQGFEEVVDVLTVDAEDRAVLPSGRLHTTCFLSAP